MNSTFETMPLGVVVERRDIDNPWQSVSWRAVAVIPGAPEIDEPCVLSEGPGWVRFHAATLAVELHRGETEGYKHNISNEDVPVVYFVLRFDEDGNGDAPRTDVLTVCPHEAQAYLESAGTDELVEPVPMPEAVQAWVRDFVAEHHVEEPFKKRGKKRWFALHDSYFESGRERENAARGRPRHD